MKKPLIVAAVVLLAACNSNPSTPMATPASSGADSSTAMPPIQSPYPIAYSSSFAIDNPKNAESLLALWKSYDGGDLSTSKDLIADTMEVHLYGGLVRKDSRDSIMAMVQSYRSSLQSAVSKVSAVMAVKSTDKNEHWALIWGKETDTHKDGKMDSVYLQEAWRFNEAGKADLLYQYEAMPPHPKK